MVLFTPIFDDLVCVIKIATHCGYDIMILSWKFAYETA